MRCEFRRVIWRGRIRLGPYAAYMALGVILVSGLLRPPWEVLSDQVHQQFAGPSYLDQLVLIPVGAL